MPKKRKFHINQIVVHQSGDVPYRVVDTGVNFAGEYFVRCITGGSDSGSPTFKESQLRRLNSEEIRGRREKGTL